MFWFDLIKMFWLSFSGKNLTSWEKILSCKLLTAQLQSIFRPLVQNVIWSSNRMTTELPKQHWILLWWQAVSRGQELCMSEEFRARQQKMIQSFALKFIQVLENVTNTELAAASFFTIITSKKQLFRQCSSNSNFVYHLIMLISKMTYSKCISGAQMV